MKAAPRRRRTRRCAVEVGELTLLGAAGDEAIGFAAVVHRSPAVTQGRPSGVTRAIALAVLAVFSGRELLHSAGQFEPRRWIKPMLAGALVFAAALPIGGFLASASGVVSIEASSGHWAITRWFLDFSFHRSVVTHAFGIAVPPLDDRLLVLKGAGAFDMSCRFCHGCPEVPQSTLARSMTPTPPFLADVEYLELQLRLFHDNRRGGTS